jgi:glycosyltransferase involved in cell wall biosynthesis
MSILAVVPAYQAARTVERVVAELVARFVGEPGVLVVDDGSDDATADLARRAGARVVRHRHNRGKGAALRTGLAWASRWGADRVVTVDADGQHPADEAWRIAGYPAPRAALVLGVRNLVAAGAPGNSRFSNALSNSFLSCFGGMKLCDTQCGLRRYPVSETLELGAWADGFAYEAEVVLRAARAGYPIEQVPVRVLYPAPEQRLSHFHVVRDPARIVLTVLSTLATTRRRGQRD